MIDGIKPIETLYKGYRFRSRLEARWAVFFDALRIEWEYEPEGVILSDGTPYLPDFWLPRFHTFFEVKNKSIKGTYEGSIAIRKISDGQRTGAWAGMICFGDPVDDDITIFCQDLSEDSSGSYTNQVHFRVVWPHVGGGEHVILVAEDHHDRRFYTDTECAHQIHWMYTGYDIPFYSDAWSLRFVEEYAKEARQARFEHGETPR